jgi:hypothetical protein
MRGFLFGFRWFCAPGAGRHLDLGCESEDFDFERPTRGFAWPHFSKKEFRTCDENQNSH